ncbi:unnamed protein product [Arabidopsis lyrata]|nr:unnamed protein product [Arabidopsis lyrata]
MSLLLPANLQQCLSSSSISLLSHLSIPPSPRLPAPNRRCLRLVTSCVSYDQSSVVNGSTHS